MKKTVLALTMAASVLALSACSDKSGGEVILSSKAGDITQTEFYEEMKSTVGENTLRLMAIEKVLDAKYKVTDKEVQAEVDKAKEQLGEQFDAYLAQQGQTPESFTEMMRLNLLQEKALVDGVEVSDKEVEQRIEEMNTELTARHVLLADEKTALEVKKKLEEGADFAEIAKEYSTEEAAQQTGGDLGAFGYGAMVPEFWNGAYALELNTISEPVQSEHGFHIIEVTAKGKAAEALATKDDTEKIREEIRFEKADPNTIIDKVGKIMKDADVKVTDTELKSALDMFLAKDEKEADKEEKETKEK